MSAQAAERGWVIGQQLSHTDLAALPVGAVIHEDANPATSQIVKTSLVSDRIYGGWRRPEGNRRGASTQDMSLGNGNNRLLSLPGPPREETLGGFKRRFAEQVTAKAAEFKAPHQTLARRALRELGCEGLIGSTVFHTSTPPNGTVAICGAPDQPEFTIFRYDGRWTRVHGHFATMGEAGVCTVTSSPGGSDPFAEVEGDQEALIAEFKDRVWEVGQGIKQRYKWCSAYDILLASFGIADPDGMPDFSAWPLVKGEEARAELPVGAVLGVARGDWGIFVKSALPNEWHRVCGTRPLAAGTMHLLFDGQGALRIEGAGPLLDFLPEGTEVDRLGGTAVVVGWS